MGFLELYIGRNLDYNALMSEVLKNLVDYLRRNHHKDDAGALIIVDELMRAFAFTSDPLDKESSELSKSMRKLVAEWIVGDQHGSATREKK
ncbi:hypothetical protein EBT16_07230 [bacterium]|nr:hypothetical protein [bacterium]